MKSVVAIHWYTPPGEYALWILLLQLIRRVLIQNAIRSIQSKSEHEFQK